MKRGMIFIATALILATGVQTGCTKQKEKANAAVPVKEAASSGLKSAPAFELAGTDGKTIKLSDYKGKVVIVDFWDTWCPPCRMEIPHFIELQNQYKSKGFEMIGVVLGREGKEKVLDFIKSNKINYVNAYATEAFLNAYGPIEGIPTTFVIDQQGRIYKSYTGYRDKAVFENDIKALLKL
ncbi:MAG TPA: TlpA disulfide reductase family protein [bacterium]|nr:TlpA disulfide reductase family protein [bacterium]HOC24609.1 TlpA disulfide reductase family protein [bacterium]HOH06536.1 TlpA disulfide reductase family protein [bacterium]HOY44369.1 TlpA disulfide reductase family protein [bacterium]HPG84872.1 TlpA disulfide reductase family protein [bacterium]